MSLFKLRGGLTNQQNLILSIAGVIFLIILWAILARVNATVEPIYESPIPRDLTEVSQEELADLLVQDSILRKNATEDTLIYSYLPPPQNVLTAFGDLYQSDNLMKNISLSVWLNIKGYMLALLLAIPIGFLIGLLPLFRGLFNRPVDAMRYLPLTAMTGLFVFWFKDFEGDAMKVAFLAVGILVYLLPVVVQRIDEVHDIHLKTTFTLGAKPLDTIRTVYLPAVFSKLSDDIRVLTAISWTYIIIAELIHNKGGIGSLIFYKGKLGQLDKVFAILVIVMIIGLIQDKVFLYLDKVLYPHKHFKQQSPILNKGIEYARYGVVAILLGAVVRIFTPEAIGFSNFGNIIMIIGAGFLAWGEFNIYKSKTT